MQCRYINSLGYFTPGERNLTVDFRSVSEDLFFFFTDISIIASLFKPEPTNTQAEVMSPRLVAEYHLFCKRLNEESILIRTAAWLFGKAMH